MCRVQRYHFPLIILNKINKQLTRPIANNTNADADSIKVECVGAKYLPASAFVRDAVAAHREAETINIELIPPLHSSVDVERSDTGCKPNAYNIPSYFLR